MAEVSLEVPYHDKDSDTTGPRHTPLSWVNPSAVMNNEMCAPLGGSRLSPTNQAKRWRENNGREYEFHFAQVERTESPDWACEPLFIAARAKEELGDGKNFADRLENDGEATLHDAERKRGDNNIEGMCAKLLAYKYKVKAS
ncbi:hypothetical protein H4582DRAFT_2052959 [Lactarius indigo]|nr:hypothetical protein H4582DRAFT_2052959 [Lactarius indigo]